MALQVELIIEGSTAVVRPAGASRRRAVGVRPQRLDGSDTADVLGRAVREAPLLRTFRRVRLQVVLETPHVLVSVERPRDATRSDEGGPSSTPPADADAFSDPVRTPVQADGSIVSVRLARSLLDGIAQGLARRRFTGTIELHLGPLLRARHVSDRVRPRAGDRPGLLIDVTRTTVSVVTVRGATVTSVHVVPATDLRSALRAAAGPALIAASTERDHGGRPIGTEDRRPWLHLAAPPPLRAGVRNVCAQLLPHGTAVDLVAVPDRG